jgi:phytanoyl-CoA hydroxylase
MITSDTHSEPKEEDYVLAPVQAGSPVLIHGLVYHKSGLNKSDMNRWIYTFHMIKGEYPYAKDNWLQPTESMPFTKLH